jgi:glutamyl-tRNA reductase
VALNQSDSLVAFSGLSGLRACSINHRTCGLPALAAVSAGAEGSRSIHAALTALGIESVVLATCNRTEVYWLSSGPDTDHLAMSVVAGVLESPAESVAQQSVTLAGEAAAAHLFRVCCGLESVVLGEAEILGQVRSAVDACAGAGPLLTGVFRAAIRTGRAARAETGIGHGALSVASTAIHWLSHRMPLSRHRVLLIGAGQTIEKAARHLHAIGVGSLVIVNRTHRHAAALAARVDAEAAPMEALSAELALADVVISAVSVSTWVLTLDQMRRRREVRAAPLVVVDLSMPASVEPGECDGLSRVDLVVLEATTRAHRHQREAEIPGVEAVIRRELAHLNDWARQEALRPLIANLHRTADHIRRDELVRAHEELRQSGDAGPVLERLSRRLLDRMLAIPIDRLKTGELPLDLASAEYVRRLFSIDERPPS